MAIGILKLFVTGFLFWSFLSTAVPEYLPEVLQSRRLPSDLQGKKVQLFIAHPDDEVMFFGPSLLEILKPEYQNTVFVTCLSDGNDQGIGNIRAEELRRSLEILGIGESFEIIQDEAKFKDSMEIEWDPKEVASYVHDDTDVILTFDEEGISSHPNHISMYKGAIESGKAVYTLKTWNIVGKYSSMFVTTAQLLADTTVRLLRVNVGDHPILHKVEALYKPDNDCIVIHSDLPSSVLIVSAMMNAHKSQMVWFRYGWVLMSRYFNANEIVRVQ